MTIQAIVLLWGFKQIKPPNQKSILLLVSLLLRATVSPLVTSHLHRSSMNNQFFMQVRQRGGKTLFSSINLFLLPPIPGHNGPHPVPQHSICTSILQVTRPWGWIVAIPSFEIHWKTIECNGCRRQLAGGKNNGRRKTSATIPLFDQWLDAIAKPLKNH